MNHVTCGPVGISPSIRTVRNVEHLAVEMGAAMRAEHICLASDEILVEERPREIGVGPTVRVASSLRGCETELSLRADHQLVIRTRRRRRPVHKYSLDLRFVVAEPVTRRRIAWSSWGATVVLVSLAALLPSVVLLMAAAGAALSGWYHTGETIELRSVHGAAPLALVIGNLGCSRSLESFMAELGRRIEAARSQVAQSKQQFLRDEMREHHRLWSEGVLPDAIYDASKRRILQAHG